MLFDVTPRAHFVAHVAIRAADLNPRRSGCFSGERMILLMRRIAQSCTRAVQETDVCFVYLFSTYRHALNFPIDGISEVFRGNRTRSDDGGHWRDARLVIVVSVSRQWAAIAALASANPSANQWYAGFVGFQLCRVSIAETGQQIVEAVACVPWHYISDSWITTQASVCHFDALICTTM